MGGLLIKSVHWNPLAIAGSRSAIATLVILALIRRPRFTWDRAQWATALAYAATVILFVTATKWTSAANAILLQYTAPIHVALFSYWFLGERITRWDWICIVSVLVGMTLFFFEKLTSEHLLGDIIALASGVAFAWLALCLRKQKGNSTMESVLLGNILAAIVCLPTMLATPLPQQDIWLVVVLGVVQLGLPYFMYTLAMTKVTALEGILYPALEPVLNPVWVALFYGERPSIWALIGGAVILSSIVFRRSLNSTRQTI